jgi:hypothetical protein
MAISPEQRAILIERLKKAQEAKRVKAEARKAAAAAVEATPPPPAPKPKAEPKPKAPKVEKEEKRENIEKEIEKEEPPKATPIVQEIYAKEQKGTYVGIPDAENEIIVKPIPPPKSKPIDIPKATKEKGYMKLKFYKEPSQKVLKRIMSIHDESSSEEEEEEQAPPQPSQADAKKAHMKQLADYYFNYY